MRFLVRFVVKLVVLIAIIYGVLIIIATNNYVRKTCDYDSWLFKIPDEIQVIKMNETNDVWYSYRTGDVLVSYKDKNGEIYTWNTGYWGDENAPKKYEEKLRKERYVIIKKDGKKLGIFKVY